jgi:hypothetical protein
MKAQEKNISDNESIEDNEEIILNFKQKISNNQNENFETNINKDSIIKKKDENFNESI